MQLLFVKVELVINSSCWNVPVIALENIHLRPVLIPIADVVAPEVIPLIWLPVINNPLDLSLYASLIVLIVSPSTNVPSVIDANALTLSRSP